MAEGAILGTTFLRIVADTSKLTPAINAVEKSTKEAGSKIEQSLNRSFAKPVDDVTKRLKTAQGAVSQFYKTIDSGGTVSAKSVNRIVAQVELARTAMVQMYGAVNKGTPDSVAKFHELEAGLRKVQVTARGVIDAQQDQRYMLAEGGVQWRGFNQTLNVAAGKYGALQMKVLAFAAAAKAGWDMGRRIGEQIGVDYQAWDGLMEHIQQKSKPVMETLGKMQLLMWNVGTFQWGSIGQDVKDTRTLQGSKFGKATYTEDPKARAKAMEQYAEAKQAEAAWASQHKATMLGYAASAALASQNFDLLREKTLAQLKVEQEAAEQKLIFDQYAERIPALREEYDKKRIKAIEDIAKLEKEQFDQEFAHATRMGTWGNVSKGILAPRIAWGSMTDTQDAWLSWSTAAETALEKVAAAYRKNATTMAEVYASALGSVENLFVGVFDVAITGKLNNLDDVFKSFFKDLTREIERMMAQKAVQALLGWVMSRYGLPTSNPYAGWSLKPGANGAIFAGGFQAFAGGGVVTNPTLGLVGEERYNEAVVPLPDGKAIPVQMKGGKREPLDVFISMDYGLIAMVRNSPDEIRAVIDRGIVEGGSTSRLIDQMIRSR